MILTIVFASAVLVFLVSLMTGGDLLRSRYLVAKQICPVIPRYFWFLIALAVVALMLCLTTMQSWWYASLITVVIALIVGFTRAIMQKANKSQIPNLRSPGF